MSKIVIGVDDSERSGDAAVFGALIAQATGATAIVACAFPYSDVPNRAANVVYREALRDQARETAREQAKRAGLDAEIRVIGHMSPAHALHDLAEAEGAALVVVGSTHTGRAGRVLPGSTGEKLLHGAPCSIAVVPSAYTPAAVARVGVAYDGGAEAQAALVEAAALARALGAQVELIGVVSSELYEVNAFMAGANVLEDYEQDVDARLAAAAEPLGASWVRLTGVPAEELIARSTELHLLFTGSRGYGPLRAVIVGGVSGRVLREAHCPVIAVPRAGAQPMPSITSLASAKPTPVSSR